jgi:hypothetical protein
MKSLIISLLLIFSISLFASEGSGFIKKLKGTATIIRENNNIEAKIGMPIYEKDKINTSSSSSIGIIFKDNTLISLGANTSYIVEEYQFNPEEKKEKFISRLQKGSMACLTGLMPKVNKDAMKIKVKTASMGIRGTHFLVSIDE